MYFVRVQKCVQFPGRYFEGMHQACSTFVLQSFDWNKLPRKLHILGMKNVIPAVQDSRVDMLQVRKVCCFDSLNFATGSVPHFRPTRVAVGAVEIRSPLTGVVLHLASTFSANL